LDWITVRWWPFVRQIIEQDPDILDKQRQGLNEDPPLILINDADKPVP